METKLCPIYTLNFIVKFVTIDRVKKVHFKNTLRAKDTMETIWKPFGNRWKPNYAQNFIVKLVEKNIQIGLDYGNIIKYVHKKMRMKPLNL
jgi:hypothetical protein